VIVNQLSIVILADVWKNLEPKLIHRGWAIYENDFGPEEDEREGEKETGLQTFSLSRELKPEKNILFQAINGWRGQWPKTVVERKLSIRGHRVAAARDAPSHLRIGARCGKQGLRSLSVL
jgi:hypothetical protein